VTKTQFASKQLIDPSGQGYQAKFEFKWDFLYNNNKKHDLEPSHMTVQQGFFSRPIFQKYRW
jgi:hypothetical protein